MLLVCGEGLLHACISSLYNLLEHAKSVKYPDMIRDVFEEHIVKAIKSKLNNEEQAWKKQHEEKEKV